MSESRQACRRTSKQAASGPLAHWLCAPARLEVDRPESARACEQAQEQASKRMSRQALACRVARLLAHARARAQRRSPCSVGEAHQPRNPPPPKKIPCLSLSAHAGPGRGGGLFLGPSTVNLVPEWHVEHTAVGVGLLQNTAAEAGGCRKPICAGHLRCNAQCDRHAMVCYVPKPPICNQHYQLHPVGRGDLAR